MSLLVCWQSPCISLYTANNDPWFHMFCKWIQKFNWHNSRVSVREFTGICEQIWCVDMCLLWNHEFFTWWHVPVKPYRFWPTITCVKLVQNSWLRAEHVYSCKYTWKHVLVERYQLRTSMNVPTGSEMVLVCWVVTDYLIFLMVHFWTYIYYKICIESPELYTT